MCSRSAAHMAGAIGSSCVVVLALVALPVVAPPVAAQSASAAQAEERGATISVDEVERGQRGYGLTVFEGTTVERFDVEVVGVLRNYDADSSVIMARLSGRGLERDGVSQGMSGSPVYLDGRLAGAVAFSWNFSQDPIAGITPIEAMRQLGDLPKEPALSWTGSPAVAGRMVPLPDLPGVDVASQADDASSPAERYPRQALLASAPDPAWLERELALLSPRPRGGGASGIQISLAGFSDESRTFLSRHVAGLAQSGRDERIPPVLEPGSAVAGLLIDGDLQAAISGTVTERDGDRILALGHPYLGVGAMSMPMAPAEVLTVISSRAASFKLTNVGAAVGTFDQDRSAGLRGLIGVEASTVPFSITVEDLLGETRHYEMQLADLPLVAPSLVAMSMLQSLQAAAHVEGVQSVELEATIDLAGHEPLTVRQLYDGQSSAMSATVYMLLLTGYLVNNPFERVEVESYDVKIRRSPEVRSATLLAARPDRSRVRPGERVNLSLALRAFRGERFEHTIEISIPDDQRAGRYYLFVGDGASIDAARMQLAPRTERDLDQALDLLRSFRTRDRLAVLAFAPSRGLIADGEPLPELPGSLRALWAASPGPPPKGLALAIEDETEVVIDRPVDGLVRVDLQVLAPNDAP